MDEQECLHERVEWCHAEPDVGISLPYFECQDCGAITTEYEMDNDYDRDADGYVYGSEWKIPVW